MQCLFLLVNAFLFLQVPSPTLGYKAAVVEYYAVSEDSANSTFLKNLNEYRTYADKAQAQGVDIIIYPEYGLTNIVDDPAEYAMEITDENPFIKELSTIAMERNIYLVVNLLERLKEPNRATRYFNTNLVFARNGSIVAKYRKINLYAEPKLTKGAEDQDAFFTTDFGVTFGIFTGDDILFENPSRSVLKNSEVKDVIFPSAWVSTLPFYSSLTVQHGYVLATGVNLLAANYGRPKESHGGSGIYMSDGKTAETYIADSPSTKLIVSDVTSPSTRPSKNICSSIAPQGLPGEVRSNVSNYVTKRDFNAADYTFKNIDLTQEQVTTEVCDDSFCCTFDISIDTTQTTSNIYKVMAFDGTVDYDQSQAHIRICSLLACENDSDDSCGNRVDPTAKFKKLTVKGNLNKEDGTIYAPLTLDSNLLPLRLNSYCDTNNGTGTTFIQLTTLKAPEDVLVFGIYGQTSYRGGSVATYGTVWLLVLAVVKSLVF